MMSDSNNNPSKRLSQAEIMSLYMSIASFVFALAAGLSFYSAHETKDYAFTISFALFSINLAARQTIYK